MREILFRGRNRDGEWFEGSYHIQDGERLKDGTKKMEHRILGLRGECEYVDPTTVGQYTGLKDKNDKQMFEGDILKRPSLRLGGPETRLLINDIRKIDRIVLWVNEWEIIGNIHDNPELMEEPAIIAREREHV